MKKISEHRAGFFKRMLSMLIIIVMAVSNLNVGSAAAQSDTGGTDPAVAAESAQTPAEEPKAEPAEEAKPEAEPTEEAKPEAEPAKEPEAAAEPAEEPAAAAEPAQEPAAIVEPTQEPAAVADGTSTNGGTDSIDDHTQINFNYYQTWGLDIYSNLFYKNEGNDIKQSGGSYEISGTNKDVVENGQVTKPGQTIIIGNHGTGETGNSQTWPLDADISVFLKGLTMDGTMTIKPVGTDTENDGSLRHKVVLTVNEASSLGALVVEDNARLELRLGANLTVESITLGENSQIVVMEEPKNLPAANNNTLNVRGAFHSKGTVALNGGTIQAKEGLSAVKLSLDGTTIKAAVDKTITATDKLSMKDSTVGNASLFGYKYDSASGANNKKTLTLSGEVVFDAVKAVGCEADSAVILSLQINDNVNVSCKNSTCYWDYSIEYESGLDCVVEGQVRPTAYRVSTNTDSLESATIQGYHTESGYTKIEEGTEGNPKQINLPELSKPGYVYKGWKLDNAGEPVKAITASTGNNITLSPVLIAEKVTVNLDRMYTPDQYTNDKGADGKWPEKKSTMDSQVDGNISLSVPTRFGYKFIGWKITSVANGRTLSPADKTTTEISYKVALADCDTDKEGNYVITMEAQWEADKFGLTLFLGQNVGDVKNLKISVDGGTEYVSLTELQGKTTTQIEVNEGDRVIQFSDKIEPITYGETISEYLKKIFPTLPEGELPILKDTSEAGVAQNFAGWSNVLGVIDGTTKFLYGEGGMLTLGKIKTLTEYQASLHQTNAIVYAAWGVMSYGLTLPDTMPAGWSVTYTGIDGKETTIDAGKPAGTVMVPHSKTVTFTTSATEPQNFSLWGFKKSVGGKIIPVEQPYKDGDSELTYQFTMPAANVTATYANQDVWIDIAKSPIEFQENVKNNNRSLKGFWYAYEIDELTPLFHRETKNLEGRNDADNKELPQGAYFYQWNFEDKFCVTSKTVATKNQLILVNALTGSVYFKELNLTMRDAYVEKTGGSLIYMEKINGTLTGGVDCEITNDGPILAKDITQIELTDYANIIVDNKTKQAYDTKLHFIGTDNIVGAIMPDTLRANDNYENTLEIQGDGKDSKGNYTSTLNLGSAFGNFVYTIKDIHIDEYDKPETVGSSEFKYLIHSSNWGCTINNAVIQAKKKNIHVGKSSLSFTRSRIDLRSINAYTGVTLSASYMRIRENLLLGYVPLKLNSSSKVVIDGNLEMNYQHWSDERDITDKNSENWLIVKGNRCDLANATWHSGTLICNALIFGRSGGISGGTVITNQILSQPVGFWKYDNTKHEYNHEASSGQTEKAIHSEDNYPFTVYAQKREGKGIYSFSGGKTYLLGHYKTTADTENPLTKKKYDSSATALDPDNPVAPFIKGIQNEAMSLPNLLDDNGDLVIDLSGYTSKVEKAAETAVKSSLLTENECIVLGNSTYNTGVRSRFIEISGNAEIYAAGNITFFNDTTVNGGSVYCKGSFGTKGDLTVAGGAITAATVGNAHHLTTTLEDGTKRWRRTDIQGGTVTADRIGAFKKKVSDGEVPNELEKRPKSTVTISDKAILQKPSGATDNEGPRIHHDVYINYIFSPDLFDNDGTNADGDKNPDNLCFEANWAQGKLFGDQAWGNSKLNFIPPNVKVEGETGKWLWDSLTGEPVDIITADGLPQYDSGKSSGANAFDRIQMKLYAVKQHYDLVFKADVEENWIESITCKGKEVKPPEKVNGGKASVTAGEKVVLTFKNSDMTKDYTVLWYIDGSGIIHNVIPLETNIPDRRITFIMPYADVEVYSTKELTLDLDNASYTLLQDGFRTESKEDPEREDSQFHYLGNLIIEQGSIEEISFTTDNPKVEDQPVTVVKSSKITNETGDEKEKKISTLHDIRVDKDFNNVTAAEEERRRVTLRHIYQTGDSYSIGINLEEGAKADFTLDGPIRICRVHVPEKADFSLSGKSGTATDAFYSLHVGEESKSNNVNIGNFYGKAGNITLRNLTILGIGTGMRKYGYGKDKGDNTVTYENCKYRTCTKGKHWYSGSYLAYNAGGVIIDGSSFNIERAENWPSPFFENCDNVVIRNGSEIIVWNNGSYDAATQPFYYGIKDSLLINDAKVSLSMREPTTDNYKMFQDVNHIAPVIELTGKSTLTLDQHARLNQLVVGGESNVYAGKNGTGYLLCPDIEVNEKGSLKAGGIVVSGFYDASHAGIGLNNPITNEMQKEENFWSEMAAGRNIYDGENKPGLVVNGGSVTAEYITGDVNGNVTVSGGTVKAPVIGTTGNLYGYTQYVPKNGEKYIYTYEKIPIVQVEDENGNPIEKTVGMKVGITGGEVQVDNYLGGMYTEVTVSGGTVELGETAVLGLTEGQQTRLTNDATAHYRELKDFGSLTITGGTVRGAVIKNQDGEVTDGGSIRMPYGTVNVSGDSTGINVYNMTADCGEITISGLTGTGRGDDNLYTNPYGGSDKLQEQEKLALVVHNDLSALNLTITKGSVVYAKRACADVPEGKQGKIEVTVDGNGRAYLYTGEAHGAIGQGDCSYDYKDDTISDAEKPGEKNVFGAKLVNVKYFLHPTGIKNVFLDGDEGKEQNINLDEKNGLPNYVVGSNVNNYQLEPASCSGYECLGWYKCDRNGNILRDGAGKAIQVTDIDQFDSTDVYLGAKWERVTVTFEIQVEAEPHDCNNNTMELVENRVQEGGTKNIYRFKDTIDAVYGEEIFTTERQLAYYITNTSNIVAVTYNDGQNGEVKITDTSNTTVSAGMADAFVKGDKNGVRVPLVLMSESVQRVRTLITLNQNKKTKPNKKSYPKNTTFHLNVKDGTEEGEVIVGNDYSDNVSVYAENADTLASIAYFTKEVNGKRELIEPTTPGYTFGGWYTDRACTNKAEVGTKVEDLFHKSTTTLYAKWTPNTYLVRFRASTAETGDTFNGSQWVTEDSTAPAVGASSVGSKDYYWVYDTAPQNNNNEKGFWVEGSDPPRYKEYLPSAWRESYVFDGWTFTGSGGKKVTSTDELSIDTMANLDVDNYVGKSGSTGGTPTPALTLYATYHPVTVTYHLRGGKWTKNAPSENPAYGTALAGYHPKTEINFGNDIKVNEHYDMLGISTGENGKEYCVLSTKNAYFVNRDYPDNSNVPPGDNPYVRGDYRESVSRKGYTFNGWKDIKDNDNPSTKYYGCAPRFTDIELEAVWEQNVYNLELHLKDDEYKRLDGTDKYESKFNEPKPIVTIKGVTVGDEISASDKWPKRTDWYAFNEGEETEEEKHRLFLGATFAGLDPGDTGSDSGIYHNYAEAVTNMLNSKTVFGNGDTFFLPDDDEYKADLAHATMTRDKVSNVPDYPTGSVIPMYGVYRERSLVFIERYVDSDGVTQNKIMHSHPWNEYSRYPFDDYKTDPKSNFDILTRKNYVLMGWYMAPDAIDPTLAYPSDEKVFEGKLDDWKLAAKAKNEYDINVYTTYVGQRVMEGVLNASTDPRPYENTDAPMPSTQVDILPDSMQLGTLSYQLISSKNNYSKPKLVSKKEMMDHQYDRTWSNEGNTYTADNTVAIELTLSKGGHSFTVPLQDAGKQKLGYAGSGYQPIGSGWKITLTLYHSKVMAKEKTYGFTIDYTFERKNGKGENVLKDQWMRDDVTVNLKPSLYDVEYRVNLPEPEDKLTETQPDERVFERVDDKTYHCTVEQGYGSALLPADGTLMLEGYDREENWSYHIASQKNPVSLKVLNLEDENKKENIYSLSKEQKEAELKDGKIEVYAGYVARIYKLKKDGADLENLDSAWTITYGDGAGDNDPTTTLVNSEGDVKYHSLVTLTPKWNPQLDLTLTCKGDKKGSVPLRVNELLGKNNKIKMDNGSYTFEMPAKDVTISGLWELYLDNGTIELFEDGFKQKIINSGNKMAWKGGYRILQCEDDNWGENPFHSTENVLKLYGDLRNRQDVKTEERQIKLGRLHITSSNSIELMNHNTQAKLTQEGKITAKNIEVPNGTELTLTGNARNKLITLVPNSGAAIGAADGGSINLDQVDMVMEGKGVPVSSGYSKYAVKGENVNVTDSQLGRENKPLQAPIHGEKKLVINGSKVYQK